MATFKTSDSDLLTLVNLVMKAMQGSASGKVSIKQAVKNFPHLTEADWQEVRGIFIRAQQHGYLAEHEAGMYTVTSAGYAAWRVAQTTGKL